MDASDKLSRRISTGLFVVDLDSGEVIKAGRSVPVQDQPFRVLAMLLEHPGSVVTREELRSRLWPADTFVGFDEGLNTAIRKLRVAFGDSADNPRYIETIPKRGYRFIAPVSGLSENPGSVPDLNARAERRLAAGAAESAPGSEGKSPTAQGPSRGGTFRELRHSKPAWAFAGIILAALTFVLVKEIPRARPPAVPVAQKRAMLVVLPFQNLSNDPTQEYFSDGLTEETITDLGQLSPAQLGVIARTSAMVYKHTNKTVEQIGRELGVNFVLEGSVRRENGRARISAQLIRVSDQTHLWAETYDAQTANDLLDVQNEIGRAIAQQVQAELTPQQRVALSKAPAVNPEAYDLYLRGRFYWNQRTPASIQKSIQLYRQATAVDPTFARAYAGLADAYNISNIVGLYSAKESLPEAKSAAMKAIALDPSLAEAHAALGMAESHYDFDFPGAREEFKKAIELNPNSAYAHLFYSNCYLMPMGQRAEAIAENKKAVALDPLSLPINNFLGESYVLAGDHSAAEQQFRRTIEMDPNFPLPHGYIAGLFELTGRFDKAITEREIGERLTDSNEVNAAARSAKLRKALREGGEKGYWKERVAQDLDAMKGQGGGISAVVLAQDYALAGERDHALKWLERSYEEREGQDLTLLGVDPVWKNLHKDARFAELLQRIGVPETEMNGR